MTNPDIADTFEQVANLLEFQGANAFRIRAYRNAARTIHDLNEPVEGIVADPQRELTSIDGLGKDLAAKVETLLQTGTLPILDELLGEIPGSVLSILRVPGLGPKRAAVIFRELGVTSLDDLREACESHKVRDLDGFGDKTEQKILDGLDIATQGERRVLWAKAEQQVLALLDYLRQCPAVERAEAAGSYRRCRDTVGDLDLLVIATDAADVMDHFAQYDDLAETLLRGDTKMSIRLRPGLQVDLRVVPAEAFGAAMVYFTGSKDHNVVLRGRARRQGLKISEYGVFRDEDEAAPNADDTARSIAGRTEDEVYAAVGLPWIPPELREARREFDWAESDAGLPVLIEPTDIRGDLHMHSTWSDGVGSIEEMARAAIELGREYIAITDHSQRAAIAGGLDVDRLRRQWDEVDRINEQLDGIRVLKGVEVDILERGGLDLPDDLLADADWIMASVHFGQNQPSEQITGRIVDALANPYVCAVAHPTGRMLLQRDAYRIDVDAIIRAAAEHGKALELNASPVRLDLDDVTCAQAKAAGVPIVISTDAHRPERLEVMRLGINQARRAGLTADDVLNTRAWDDVRKMLSVGG